MAKLEKVKARAEQLFSRSATAKLLDVSVDTVDKLIRKGASGRPGGLRPVYRVGRLTKIPESAIETYLRIQRIA